jgi:hypothetical protein
MSDDFIAAPGGPKRLRRVRPLGAQAQARLEMALIVDKPVTLPTRGDIIEIRWPGGPYNFEMKFIEESRSMPVPPAGWYYLHGQVLKPRSWNRATWTVMVHWVVSVNGAGEETSGWTMLPRGGKLSDVEP